MAITARFTADFSQFEASLKSASVTINTFEKGVKSAAADLNRLASSLSGANIQREAATIATAIESIGGAAKLTTAEAAKMLGPIDQAIDKYKALGEAVPPELEKIQKELGEITTAAKAAEKAAEDIGEGVNKAGSKAGSAFGGMTDSIAKFGPALAGAFAVDKLVGFAGSVRDLASQIKDLSDRTGASTTDIQEFQHAAESTGSSIEAYAGGISKLSDKLVEQSAGTREALESIGLTFEELAKQDPGAAFASVAEAIGKIQDPARQTQLAMELFGKAGVEMLPAIREGMQGLRDDAHNLGLVMSEDAIRAVDDFDQAWQNMLKRAKVSAAETFKGLTEGWKELEKVGPVLETLSGHQRSLNRLLEDYINNLSVLRENREALLRSALKDFPTPAAFTPDTGARTRAAEEAAEATRRAKEATADYTKAQNEAASAAKSHAAEIKRLRDQLSGAALQGEIRKLEEAWKGLSKTQQANADTLKRVVPQLEAFVTAGGKLPPTLQKIYDENRKLLPTITEVSDRFRNQIIVLGNYSQAAERAANRTKGLRDDGLLPVTRSFAGMTDAIDTSAIRTNNLAGQFQNAADAAAALEKKAKDLTKLELGKAIGEAIGAGLMAEDQKVAAIMGNLGQVGVQAFTSSMQSGITAAVSAGTMTAGMGMLAMTGVGLMAAGFYVAIQDMIAGIGEGERLREARLAGNAVREQFMQGFGGPEAFAEFAKRAGASVEQLTPFTVSAGTMEEMQLAIAEISPVLQDFIDKLEGLAVAAQGVNRFAGGLNQQFKDTATFTAENVDRINNLGLLIGGVMANTVARTGDLVGAIQAVGPALTTLDALRDKADLADQLTPATQQVLMLYDTVSDNEDAFNAIAGIGQMMTGLGEAMVANTPLANAFGQELAAQFTILRDRGVEANVALSSMAPQLQELWELSKEGRVTVDDTTQALLDQAEAAGVVGADMMDANEQIVSILTEIRDLFAESLPAGMLETGKSAQGLAEQMGPGLKTAAQTGTQAVTTGSQQQQKAIKDAQFQAQAYAKQLGTGTVDAARLAGGAIDELGRKRLVIPVDFEMGDLPEYAGGAPEGSGAGSTTVNVNLDGETIARATAPHIPGVVEAYGVS